MLVAKNVKAADQIWIALALLLKEHPERDDFSPEEIKGKLLQEFGLVYAPTTIFTHISKHCVASEPPNPARYRILTRTSRGRYRLFRPEDYYHPERENGKIMPSAKEIPAKHLFLLDWYKSEHCAPAKVFGPDAPLLRVQTGASGLRDVSVSHDRYLADASQETQKDDGNIFTH